MPTASLAKAIQFTARAHRDQLRKGTDTPYIAHPFAVGLILSQLGFPEPVIAAGFLHDTLEDCGITVADLTREFGTEIAAIVVGCSEPDKFLPWRERKQHTIDALANASWQIKAVVAADKLDNLRAMSADFTQVGDALWSRFKEGREQQQWYYGGVVQALLTTGPGEPHGLHELRDEFDETARRFFARANCTRSITLDRRACDAARAATTRSYIAVDPETCAAQLIKQTAEQASVSVQGHEDIFRSAWRSSVTTAFCPAATGRRSPCPVRASTTIAAVNAATAKASVEFGESVPERNASSGVKDSAASDALAVVKRNPCRPSTANARITTNSKRVFTTNMPSRANASVCHMVDPNRANSAGTT